MIKLVAIKALLLLSWIFFSLNSLAAGLPDKCVQLPQRSTACPNIVYKRSPIDFPLRNITQGEIFCICMTDFVTLRIAAESEIDKVNQSAELSLKSVAMGIEEQDLLKLIRH